jgi:two-component system LytT family response regulator
MNLGCYIIDDEQSSAELLIEYIRRHDGLHLLGYEQDPGIAASKILSGEIKADLCFLDVQMAGIDGIELGKMIRNITGIIFSTGYREYAPEAYELDAIDYLLKPVRYARFIESIEKSKRFLAAKYERQVSPTDIFFIKDVINNTTIKVKSTDLICIQSNGNFVFLHINGRQKPVMTNLSMTAAASKVSGQKLAQVHKGFVINIAHITLLDGNLIKLSNDEKVPLSRRFRNDFIDQLKINTDKVSR